MDRFNLRRHIILSFFVIVFSSNLVVSLSNALSPSQHNSRSSFLLTNNNDANSVALPGLIFAPPAIQSKRGLLSDDMCSRIDKPPPGAIVAWAQYKEQLRKCWEDAVGDSSDPDLSGIEDEHDEHAGHNHSEISKGALIGYKMGALALMAITAIAGCIIPLLLHRTKFFARIMTYVNSFACGAFLGLAFFHLLPESLYLTESARLGFNVGNNWYNLLFPLAFVGFVLILIFEKVLLVGAKQEVAIVGHCHGHGHDGECSVDLESPSDFKHRHDHHADHDADDCMERKLQDHEGHSHTAVLDTAEQGTAPSSTSSKVSVPVHHFSALTLLATLSLSIHSVFEGIVVGTFDEGMSVWVAAVSICGHKWAAGFALAANCVKANVSRSATWIYLAIFIISSPIGVLIGIGVSNTNYAFVGAVDAISLGTILYTGCELLFSEFGTSARVRKELLKFTFLMLGALMVFGLYMAHVAGGSHEHGSESTGGHAR